MLKYSNKKYDLINPSHPDPAFAGEGSIFPYKSKILLPAGRDQNDNNKGAKLEYNFILF